MGWRWDGWDGLGWMDAMGWDGLGTCAPASPLIAHRCVARMHPHWRLPAPSPPGKRVQLVDKCMSVVRRCTCRRNLRQYKKLVRKRARVKGGRDEEERGCRVHLCMHVIEERVTRVGSLHERFRSRVGRSRYRKSKRETTFVHACDRRESDKGREPTRAKVSQPCWAVPIPQVKERDYICAVWCLHACMFACPPD